MGNHFIEVNVDDDGNKYLVIHSGSRHLGLEIANHYQKIAKKECDKRNKQVVIDKLKKEGREREITDVLRTYRPIHKGLEYLTGSSMEDYLHDIKIVQDFATLSRKMMADKICDFLGVRNANTWETKHNYIDTDSMILRKGAVDATEGKKLLIPINMRDGSLLCIGKGNEEYNYSAPHGAGRLMSRSKAKERVNLDEFKSTMKGVYTTCVNESTLDESPFAYKPIEEIIENSKDTVDIIKVIKPIYNFKSC